MPKIGYFLITWECSKQQTSNKKRFAKEKCLTSEEVSHIKEKFSILKKNVSTYILVYSVQM
jgi:hypothetical protein